MERTWIAQWAVAHEAVWVPRLKPGVDDITVGVLVVEGDSYGVLYTRPDWVKIWPPEHMVCLPTHEVLRAMLRYRIKGLLLDPGTEAEKVLNLAQTLWLLHDCRIRALGQPSGSLWVPVYGGEMVEVEIFPGVHACPLYLSLDDAAEGFPVMPHLHFRPVSWSEVWDHCLATGSDLVVLQWQLPDYTVFNTRDLSALCGDGRRTELDLLEEALGENLDGFLAALALVDRFWVLLDEDLNVLGTEEGMDLFTSSLYAAAAAEGMQNLGEPRVFPYLLDTDMLLPELLDSRPHLCFNRGQGPRRERRVEPYMLPLWWEMRHRRRGN